MMGVDDLDPTTADDPGHARDEAQLYGPFVTRVLQGHSGADRHLGLFPVPRSRKCHIDTRSVQTHRQLHTLVVGSTPVEQGVEL